MNERAESPFPSIEAAQEYVDLLVVAVKDAREAVEGDFPESGSANARRIEALRLVCFKLMKLEQNLQSSRRLLHDLKVLRRLMLRDDGVAVAAEETPMPVSR